MDRRRALLAGGGFPVNYIFKQGLGFRKDVNWGKGTQKGGYYSVTKDSIWLDGYYNSSSNTGHATIYIGEKVVFDSSNRLLSNPIINEKYTKLFIHFNVKSSDGTRPSYIGLINCDKLPNSSIRNEQNGSGYNKVTPKDTTYFVIGNTIHGFLGVTSAEGEYTLEFDVSNIDKIMLNFWSGNFSSRDLIIYDIWLE